MNPGWERLRGQALRFLLAGGINTLATLGLYWLLLPAIGYGPAYTVSFVAGIAISYLLNVRFVFRVAASPRSAVLFPGVYAVQYCVGLAVLWLWSSVLGLSPAYGVIASIAVTVPLTFILARLVLKR